MQETASEIDSQIRYCCCRFKVDLLRALRVMPGGRQTCDMNDTHMSTRFEIFDDEDGTMSSLCSWIAQIIVCNCVMSGTTNVPKQQLNLWTDILLTEDPESLAKAVVVDGGEDVLERWRMVADAVEALKRSNEASEATIVPSISIDNDGDDYTDSPDIANTTNSSDNAVLDNSILAPETADSGEIASTACRRPIIAGGTLSTEILRQLARLGLLTAPELGRLLLLVSKVFCENLGPDFCWRALCSARFSSTTTVTQQLLPFEQLWQVRDYHWLFRQLDEKRVPPVESPPVVWPPLPEPRLQPHQLHLLVNIYNEKGSQIVGEVLRDTNIADLLRTGETCVDLQTPIDLLGSYSLTENGRIENMPKEEDFQAYSGLVHGLRLDTYQCACLHETHEICWDAQHVFPPPSPSPSDQIVDQVHNPDMAVLYLGPKSHVQLASQGKDLETRIARGEHPAGGFDVVVALVLRAIPISEKDDTSTGRRVQLQFHQLQLQVWGNYSERLYIYNSQEENAKHAVTLLHIIDELWGWEDRDP